MHGNKPRKTRYSKSIVGQINPIHPDDADDDYSGHAELSRQPSTSSMTVLISPRASSSPLTSQVGQPRNYNSSKTSDISQTDITQNGVFIIDRPTFHSFSARETAASDQSSVRQICESALEIESLTSATSSCSSSRNTSIDHSSILELELSVHDDAPSLYDTAPVIARSHHADDLLRVSCTNSFDADEMVCPPSWMSPSDISNDCLWQPMKPGYAVHADSVSDLAALNVQAEGTGSAVVIRRHTVQVERYSSEKLDGSLKNAIPIMPRTLAIVCCVMNVISPGAGTFLSAVSVTCCSLPQQRGAVTASLIWLNMWVALLQFITTPLFLLGWFWSVAWGLTFIKLSYKYSRQKEFYNDDQHNSSSTNQIFHVTSDATLSTTTSTTRTTTTTTTLSLPDLGARSDRGSIIVLHEAPIIVETHHDISSSTMSIDDDLYPHTRRFHSRYDAQHRRRSLVRFSGDVSVPSWSTISYPQLLLAPGALESIVMNNGTYVTTNDTGRDQYRGHRSGRRHARQGMERNRTTVLGNDNASHDTQEETSSTHDSSESKAYMGTMHYSSHR